MFWRKKISLKFLFGVILPAILIFCVAGNLVLRQVHDSILAISTGELDAKSESIYYQVREYFTRYQEIVIQLAENEQIQEMLRSQDSVGNSPYFEQVEKTIARIKRTNSNLFQVWLIALNSQEGVFPGEPVRGLPEYDIAGRPWYDPLMTADSLFLTEPYLERTGTVWIVSIMLPLYENGRMVGATSVDLSLEDLTATLGKFPMGKEGIVLLMSDGGNLVYHPDPGMIGLSIEEIGISGNVSSAVRQSQSDNYAFQLDGISYYGSLRHIDSNGWMVLTALPESELYEAYENSRSIILLIFGLGILLLILFTWAIVSSLVRPVRRMAAVANQIADGKLDVDIAVHTIDETADVALALHRTTHKLNEYMGYIDEVVLVLRQIALGNLDFYLTLDYSGEFQKIRTELLNIQSTMSNTFVHIQSAAHQVEEGAMLSAQAAQVLSQGAREQRHSIMELESTIGDIAEKVQRNTQHALQANQEARQVAQSVEDSNHWMQETTRTMTEISQASVQIKSITSAIEDIAFQTNLLALNASVEAARAGAAGKSFAVVAGQVKNLAASCSNSANDIAGLIEASVKTIAHGVDVAEKAAHSLSQVVVGAHEVAGSVGKISTETSEQDELIQSVERHVGKIADVVRTNQEIVEQKAASSEELAAQSQSLHNMLAQFRFGKGEQALKKPATQTGFSLKYKSI